MKLNSPTSLKHFGQQVLPSTPILAHVLLIVPTALPALTALTVLHAPFALTATTAPTALTVLTVLTAVIAACLKLHGLGLMKGAYSAFICPASLLIT